MSDSASQSPALSFGVPESHFIRLTADLLKGLELQSRERGLESLANLIAAAKLHAESSLRTSREGPPETPEAAEIRLLKIVGAIRGKASDAKRPAGRTRR